MLHFIANAEKLSLYLEILEKNKYTKILHFIKKKTNHFKQKSTNNWYHFTL